MDRSISMPAREVPLCHTYDVLIAGGGVGGIAAALAAARHGARVCLLERGYMLGGLATAGLVTIYLPLDDGEGRQVSFGIAEELLRVSISHGCERLYPGAWLAGETDPSILSQGPRYETQYNAQLAALLWEKLLIEAGVDIYFGTMVTDAAVSDGRLTHIMTQSVSGERAFAVTHGAVDATGDAVLLRAAGEATETYRIGNVLASWYYFLKDGVNTLQMLGYAEDPSTPEDSFAAMRHYAALEADEVSEMVRTAHASVLRHFLSMGELNDRHALTTIATIPQLRMTRRIVGRYALDTSDERRAFPDSIGIVGNWRKRGPAYEVPFSTLIGTKVCNLAAAGRTTAATDKMHDITRVIPVCAVTGQAAGTALALSEDLFTLSTDTLRDALCADGVRVSLSALG